MLLKKITRKNFNKLHLIIHQISKNLQKNHSETVTSEEIP